MWTKNVQEPETDAIHDDGQFTSQLLLRATLVEPRDRQPLTYGQQTQQRCNGTVPPNDPIDLKQLLKKMVRVHTYIVPPSYH
jgi:hypothetical protein